MPGIKKTWPESAIEKAKQLVAEEPELLKKSFSPEFAEFANSTGLYFSFGDISWLINSALQYNIFSRHGGSCAGIAHFETLIMRFRLYLIRELKVVLANKPPYGPHDRGVDYNFVQDFLDLFHTLDKMDELLKEIREREGGMFA